MKKTILIIALALISAATFAQKKDTTAKHPVAVKDTVDKKPEFKPDLVTPRHVELSVSDVSYLIMTPDDWSRLEWSDRYSGQQIQQMKTAAAVSRAKLNDQVTKLLQAEKQKFDTDTARNRAKSNPGKG